MAKDYKKTKQYKELRADLMRQLEVNNTSGKYFEDMVNDYMDLWVIKNQLIDDVAERGVITTYKNGANQYGTKKNDSLDTLLKVNSQMLRILTQLKIEANEPQPDTDDDEL